MADIADRPVPRTFAPVLVDIVRRLRLARLVIRLGRARHQSVRDTLHAAIDLLVEKDNEITRLRAQLQQLRDEHRRVRDELQRYVASVTGAESA